MSIRIVEHETGELIDCIGAWKTDYRSFHTFENVGHEVFTTIPDIKYLDREFDEVSGAWYDSYELPDGYTIV